ncbi:NS16 [American grass carp reovirus]|uniref:Non-structural protein 5 n=1 Tax=Aquareovirus G (isolate American grass carp/USA/PB01-155/-) TaxID=648234 RepID=VNS5_AQRVG|nr:NS16 [American grass carp reovirus]B2BNE5.1 RecName: Full=Non-structural protein 5; Short=NS5; AltName: Full=NS16 [American grass carp reovirus PB01-155]ABV01045.1 NS16 [American grass carp reovirus]
MPCQDTVSLSIQHTHVIIQNSCCTTVSTSASTSATAYGLGCLALGCAGIAAAGICICCLIHGCPACPRRLGVRKQSSLSKQGHVSFHHLNPSDRVSRPYHPSCPTDVDLYLGGVQHDPDYVSHAQPIETQPQPLPPPPAYS